MKKKETSKLSIQDDKKRAVIYARVSTKEQEEHGTSLDTQIDTCMNYVEKHGYTISKSKDIYRESQSASTDSRDIDDDFTSVTSMEMLTERRPRLREIIHQAQAKGFDHLIVYGRDRFCRNFKVYCLLKMYFYGLGIQIHYSKPGEDINTNSEIMDNFVDLVLANVYELEAGLIGSRVRSSYEKIIKEGYWPGGRPPYGLITKEAGKVNGKKRKCIEISPIEADEVKKVFELYNDGFSYRKIADMMNTYTESNCWSKGKVEGILRNNTYVGSIAWGRGTSKKNKGKTPEPISSGKLAKAQIISDQTWELSQQNRMSKSQCSNFVSTISDSNTKKDSKYFTTPFLLRGKVYCGICNQLLATKSHGKYKNGLPRDGEYICKTESCNSRSIRQSLLEDIFINTLTKEIRIANNQKLADQYKLRIGMESGSKNQLVIALNEKIATKNDILSKLQVLQQSEGDSDPILSEVIAAELLHITQDIESLELRKKQLNNTSVIPVSISNFQKYMETFINKKFVNLEIERKRTIVDALVYKVIVKPHSISNSDETPPYKMDIVLNIPTSLHNNNVN